MRMWLVCLTLLTFLISSFGLAHAKTWGPAKAASPNFNREAILEKIFERMRTAKNEIEATKMADEMWLTFMTAPDEETAEDLNQALRARGGYNFEKAHKILNRIIDRHPDYAEGWNQRAYIHFLRERYDESLADCRQALVLEPRHIGCLSGIARILIRHTKNYEDGEKFLKEAVRLNPFIFEKKLFDELPKEEL